jgi:hypothetical protein
LSFRGCEAILFSIRALFDLNSDCAMMQVDIKNVFNSVSRTTIFKELCYVKGHLANIVLLQGCYMTFIFLITISMDGM